MPKLPTWGFAWRSFFSIGQFHPMSRGGERRLRVDIVEKVADQLILILPTKQ
jgi:hypothetical protein